MPKAGEVLVKAMLRDVEADRAMLGPLMGQRLTPEIVAVIDKMATAYAGKLLGAAQMAGAIVDENVEGVAASD